MLVYVKNRKSCESSRQGWDGCSLFEKSLVLFYLLVSGHNGRQELLVHTEQV